MNWQIADGDGVIWHLRGLHIPVLGVNQLQLQSSHCSDDFTNSSLLHHSIYVLIRLQGKQLFACMHAS